MTPFEYAYSTRSAKGLVVLIVATIIVAVGIGIVSSAQGAGKTFAFFITAFSTIGACHSAYGLIYPVRWSLRITDGLLEWDSPKWPKSKRAVRVSDISVVDTWSSEGGDTMHLSMNDGTALLVPKNCLGDMPRLIEQLLSLNPRVRIERHEGTPNQAL